MKSKKIVVLMIFIFNINNLISYTYKIVNMTGEPLKMGKVEYEKKTSFGGGDAYDYRHPKKGSDFGNVITLIYNKFKGLCRVDNVELEPGQSKEINSVGCCLKDIAIGGGTSLPTKGDKTTNKYLLEDYPAKQYLLKDKFMCKGGTFKIHKKHDGTYYLGGDQASTYEAATKEAAQMDIQAKSGNIELKFIPVKHISVEVQNSLWDQNKTAIAKHADKSGILHNYVKSFSSFKTISPLQLETAEDMVTAGLLNQKDINGETPLFWAVKNGNRDWVLFLVRHKADIFSKNNNGQNVLHIALKNGDLYIIQLIIKAAQVLLKEPNISKDKAVSTWDDFIHAKDKNGNTPLNMTENQEIKMSIMKKLLSYSF